MLLSETTTSCNHYRFRIWKDMLRNSMFRVTREELNLPAAHDVTHVKLVDIQINHEARDVSFKQDCRVGKKRR